MNLFASLTNLFSGGDLFILLLVILLLFGAKKLPELARGMGQAMREFQKAKDEFTDELHKADSTNTAAKPAQSTVPRIEAPQAGTQAQSAQGQQTTPTEPSGQA